MAVVELEDVNNAVEKIRLEKKKDYLTVWKRLEDVGKIIDSNLTVRLGNFEGVNNAWADEDCYVIGSGASLKGFDFELLRGKHTIVINHTVEYWDGFEWLVFLDQRFLNKTTINISKFKGRIFASNQTNLYAGDNITVYKPIRRDGGTYSTRIEDGLYCYGLTGVVAVNLAIISGAKHIYLLGLDGGGQTNNGAEGYYFSRDYKGQMDKDCKKTFEHRNKHYYNVSQFMETFKPFAKKITNLSKNASYNTFEKKDWREHFGLIKKELPIVKKINKSINICHLGLLDFERMGDITRLMIDNMDGNNQYCKITDSIPNANIYILHCFMNHSELFINFQKPNKNCKVVSVVHSAHGCLPALCSDVVITLTNAHSEMLEKKYKIKSKVINAGIDFEKYNKKIDYSNRTFGRITRWTPAKIHKNWESIVENILNDNQENKCIMITEKEDCFNLERCIFNNTVKINDIDSKIKALSELSVYTHLSNGFQETFSMGLLEAMASGLCCIVENNSVLKEVLGDAGINVNNESEFIDVVKKILSNEKLKKEYGEKAKERAKLFSVENMIKKYNEIINELMS